MAEKTVKRIVKHPKLNLVVKGERQRMKVGAEVTLTAKAAERLEEKGFVENPSAKPAVDATKPDKAAEAEAKAAKKERDAAVKALDKRQKAVDAARKEKDLSAEQIEALDNEQKAIDDATAKLID